MPNSSETYWSLVIESNFIQSAIWEIEPLEKKAKVLAISPAAHWEDEDLVSAADSVLSSAASELPDTAKEPTKTVFGVASSWVEGGQIKEEYIDKIRTLCASLSLEPSGFVVIPEAIAYFVKSNEGSPLTGIVIGIGQENIEVSVFKLGNLVGNVSVARSVSAAEDVIEGLVRFKLGENLPSRILVFDGKEGQLEEVRQSLINVDWMSADMKEKLNFLHIPKIEIIDPKEKVLAVCLAGASEIGQAQKIDFAGDKEEDSFVPEERNFDETEVTPEELGFMAGDISKMETPMVHTEPQNTFSQNHFPQAVGAGLAVPNIKLPALPFKFNLRGILNPIKEFINSIRFPRGRNGLFFILGGIGLALIIGLVAWFFLQKATVTVYVSPKKIDTTKTITMGSDLKGSKKTVSVDGDKSSSVTGTKTVGDRAKGEVTLTRSGDEITLNAGTKVTDPSGLIFTLDKDTTVPAGDLVSQGTVKTAVTGSDIGAEYNLASGTTFSVTGYSTSDLIGKNESSFSGGSSREITAVSADDRSSLEEKLADELTETGKEKLNSSLSPEDFLIESSVEATASSKQFNHKVGDEASDLKLSMTMDVTGLVVARGDLNSFAMNALSGKVPTGFVLRSDQIKSEFELVSGSKNKYDVTFTANLLPEIKTDELIKKILGKTPVKVEEILSGIPGYVRSRINLSINFGPLATLPRLTKNITIEIASEK